MQLPFEILHEPFGKQTFSALSTAFCQAPELKEVTSRLKFRSAGISYLSLDADFPIQIYEDESPIMLVSLSECASFAHIIPRQDVLTIICQKQFPIIAFLWKYCADEMDELCTVLQYQEEFLADELQSDYDAFVTAFSALLAAAFKLDISEHEMSELIDDIRCQRVIRDVFTHEDAFIKINSTLGFILPFMQRLGKQPGEVCCLMKGSVYKLGKGEYITIGGNINFEQQAIISAEQLISSAIGERIYTRKIESAAGSVERSNFNNCDYYTMVKSFARCIKEIHYGMEIKELEIVPKSIFESKKMYLFANCGQLEMDGQKKLVPGQYEITGSEKVKMVCETGMLNYKTPCFLLIGAE